MMIKKKILLTVAAIGFVLGSVGYVYADTAPGSAPTDNGTVISYHMKCPPICA